MEAKLYQKYHFLSQERRKVDLWQGIVARQVPLYDSQAKASWGEIDLLGVDADWRPVVIELKLDKGQSNESPQRPLFEAVAYAIALRTCWSDFRPEFDAVVTDLGGRLMPDGGLDRVPVVLLAPAPYWDYWLRRHELYGPEQKAKYSSLVIALKEHGIDVTIAEMTLDASGEPDVVVAHEQFLQR